MFSPSRDSWAHKAHALLLPTPLAAPAAVPFSATPTDPAEVTRAHEVLELLDRHGLGVTEWTPQLRELHATAHRDAYDAHVTAPPGVLGRPPNLRHPLSGAPLPHGNPLREGAWADFIAHLDRVLGNASFDAAAAYAALWRALMETNGPFGLDHIPGHPVFNDHSLLAHRSAAAALVGARLDGAAAALLHLHVGPVQGFIAAARRTHDLSLGSYIIAYLSFHAIKKIADLLGPDAILYPDLATLPLYAPNLNPLHGLRASLPNRFMAIVPAEHAAEIAQAAASAVANTWSSIASRVKAELRSPPGERFDHQIVSHLEMDATLRAWTPGGADAQRYTVVFTGVRDDLTAQRRLITALPPAGEAVAKCTQCGDREQIGEDTKFWQALRKELDARFSGESVGEEDRETIDLRDGEALCAVCLTKRFANRWYFGRRRQDGGSSLDLCWSKSNTDRLLLRFPSVATIASAPVRYALSQSSIDPSDWEAAVRACHHELRFTAPGNLLPGLGGPKRTKRMHLDADGTWFYDTSYEAATAIRDHDLLDTPEDLELIRPRLLRARARLQSLLGALAEPSQHRPVHVTPYYAVICLDVDRMGKWLDGTHKDALKRKDFLLSIDAPEVRRDITPALHREVSRRQSRLASDPIYSIVEKEHLGRVIYSGGDDLLAFVPLATVWRCLTALQELFRSDEHGLGSKATLSAGVSITHWRDPLSHALRLARDAEEEAKETRDRLVVKVDKRSGVPLTHVAPWSFPPLLHSLDVLAEWTEDRPEAGAEDEGEGAVPKIRLNTLERLERELAQLSLVPAEAIRARTFLHLTGRRFAKIEPLLAPQSLLGHLNDLCMAAERANLVSLLHLLRFLAREHDSVIAGYLPSREAA